MSCSEPPCVGRAEARLLCTGRLVKEKFCSWSSRSVLLSNSSPVVSAVPERLFTVASLATPPTVVADGVVTVGVAVVVLLLLAVHVRSVVSPEVDCPSCFAASLPGLSGALGCPSSGEGAIVRFRLRFHNRPVAEVYSAPR
uniref:Uncharacterized protein n=1 Tax=Anopheles merus TaxID=30066 RepID=A0A182VLQ4_ANOME